jgi:amino acid transporter
LFLLLRGAKESATVNAIMVMIKLAILVFFAVIAFSGFHAEHFTPFFNTDNSKGLAGMAGVTAAAGTVFFSLSGLIRWRPQVLKSKIPSGMYRWESWRR